MQGGERRLNVLISRARERCEVFSSLTADDIDLERGKSRGVAAFKTFLRYAATGILDSQTPTGGDFDSDFERQVAVALQGLGHQVHRQVGTAGFRSTWRSSPPPFPGVTCSGSSAMGPRITRRAPPATATDFARRCSRTGDGRSTESGAPTGSTVPPSSCGSSSPPSRGRQRIGTPTRKLKLKRTNLLRLRPSTLRSSATVNPTRRTARPPTPGQSPTWNRRRKCLIRDPSPRRALRTLEKIVTEIVRVEGPIHQDEIARRIIALWGGQRTGARIGEAITNAIAAGVRSENLRLESDFASHADQTTSIVRNRSAVTSSTLQKPEMVPPSELRQAIIHLVTEQVGLRREDLPRLVRRALGVKTTSAKLRDLVEKKPDANARGIHHRGAGGKTLSPLTHRSGRNAPWFMPPAEGSWTPS